MFSVDVWACIILANIWLARPATTKHGIAIVWAAIGVIFLLTGG